MSTKNYGKELILDLHECDSTTFNRWSIFKYFETLCEKIDMERCELHFWDDLYTSEKDKQTEPHLVGTSAVQFITTSNITIHTLDLMERVYLNIFSCKEFDAEVVLMFSVDWFKCKNIKNKVVIDRM